MGATLSLQGQPQKSCGTGGSEEHCTRSQPWSTVRHQLSVDLGSFPLFLGKEVEQVTSKSLGALTVYF